MKKDDPQYTPSTKDIWPNYKGYRAQVLDCIAAGNQFLVPCVQCQRDTTVCVKYKTYCHSKVCLNERKNGDVSFV